MIRLLIFMANEENLFALAQSIPHIHHKQHSPPGE